jgi:hypothetical protein
MGGQSGQPFDPAQVNGISFGFNTFPDTPNTGEIWVDDLRLLTGAGEEAAASADTEANPAAASAPTSAAEQPTEAPAAAPRMCGGSIALLGVGMVVLARRNPRRKGNRHSR